MKKLYTIVVGLLFMSTASLAQLADQPYSVEAVKHHEGTVGNTDLTGFTTYRVYLHLQNQSDFVSALYGNDPGDNTIPFSIDFSCDLYQHPDGAFLGNNISSGLAQYIPEVAYDSWFAIGAENSDAQGDVNSAFADPAPVSAVQSFNENGSLTVSDGAIFTLNDQQHPNGEAKLDQFGEKKVLIGQFTTCGDFEWCFNVQLFPNRNTDVEVRESLCISNACPDNVTNANWEARPATATDSKDGQIIISTTEDVSTYNLYKVNTVGKDLIATSNAKKKSAQFEGLESGLYYVELDRGGHCRPSTELIDIRSSGASDGTSGVEDAKVNNDLNISVYPNPGTGIYNLELNEDADVRYQVRDLQGRIVSTGKVSDFLAGSTKSFDISSSENGTYIVKVFVEDEVKNIRLIKAD